MFPFTVTLLALVVTSVPFTLGFDDIKVDPVIMAGTDIPITIDNDFHRGDRSNDAQFDYFRVYLSVNPPESDRSAVCYLTNSSSIDVTSLKVNIPPTVGPNDSQYAIAVSEFNQAPVADNPGKYQYSDNFYFEGGSTMYSQYELDGYLIGYQDSIPCYSYDCARQCAQSYYPDDALSDNGLKKELDCISRCPGVTLPAGLVDSSNSTSVNTTNPSTTNYNSTSFANSTSTSSYTLPTSTVMFAATATPPSPTSSWASSTATATPTKKNAASHSMPSALVILIAYLTVLVAEAWR